MLVVIRSAWSTMEPSVRTYTLFAIPSIFATGTYEGELKGITFIAQSPAQTLRWFVLNCGQFDHVLAEILPPGTLEDVLRTLRWGKSLILPGSYRAEQFDRGFHPSPGFTFSVGQND